MKDRYYTNNRFSEKLLTMKMNKTEVEINKPVYLGLLIVGLSQVECMSLSMVT